MRYFDAALIANSAAHVAMWETVSINREWFHRTEDTFAELAGNAASILPRDAWLDLDTITTRVMRDDEGDAFMSDLMPLARPVNIGKLVNMHRVAGDSTKQVRRSLSGQIDVPLDKIGYDYRGNPVPIFANGYGREWREWNTLQSENFDALADDQEAFMADLREDMALYALDGDATIVFQGYTAYGIRTSPLSKSINIGAGGSNIDLTSSATTADAIEAFINGAFGAMLDANLVNAPVNLYVSPEIMRNLDRPYSLAGGFKVGSIREQLERNRRINKIAQTYKLSGNEFFGFVPNSRYIRPLIGMAANTVAKTRHEPNDNYQFMNWAAMGIEIRADFNGKAGVFYSVTA